MTAIGMKSWTTEFWSTEPQKEEEEEKEGDVEEQQIKILLRPGQGKYSKTTISDKKKVIRNSG
jgi:hypothetical protein